MPALDTDIAGATREAVQARYERPAIRDRYPSARDNSLSPREGFFDALGDAQVVIDQEAALLGVERRRFAVTVQDLLWLDPAAGTPTLRLVDAAQAANGLFLAARIELDLDAETTSLELFG